MDCHRFVRVFDGVPGEFQRDDGQDYRSAEGRNRHSSKIGRSDVIQSPSYQTIRKRRLHRRSGPPISLGRTSRRSAIPTGRTATATTTRRRSEEEIAGEGTVQSHQGEVFHHGARVGWLSRQEEEEARSSSSCRSSRGRCGRGRGRRRHPIVRPARQSRLQPPIALPFDSRSDDVVVFFLVDRPLLRRPLRQSPSHAVFRLRSNSQRGERPSRAGLRGELSTGCGGEREGRGIRQDECVPEGGRWKRHWRERETETRKK
mmetsp:Transcript_26935/g.53911  ORF Transcript_26935/g.53911 Transcript_26935/m.53911 type:complete len:259 (+) Transcript_26935:274-1050(+)